MSNKSKENTELVDRPIKYRYVYFNTNKRRKKQLLKKIIYGIYEYPKTVDIDKIKETL